VLKVSFLLQDDTFLPATWPTPLTDGAVNEALRQFAPHRDDRTLDSGEMLLK